MKKDEELERKCNNGDRKACDACARSWLGIEK